MKIEKVLIHWHDEFPADPIFILLVDEYDPEYCLHGFVFDRTPDYTIFEFFLCFREKG